MCKTCPWSPDNQCASHCLQNIPFQGDNFNVCGVAAIISDIILSGYFNAIPIEETMCLSNIVEYLQWVLKKNAYHMVFGRKNIDQLT